jgi:glycosyltransferase involved in cell wall biosynthesis
LFLPMHGIPPNKRARIVPGKTYEYLASGRPILAAVPPGDARDFLLASGHTAVADPSDVPAIADAIRFIATGEVAFTARSPSIDEFERRELAKVLAGILTVSRVGQ